MNKNGFYLSFVFSILFLTFLAGCEPDGPMPPEDKAPFEIYSQYHPKKAVITPLTEFIEGDDESSTMIKVYVSLNDSKDASVKSPGVFRFELFDYTARSSDVKGSRLIIWEDINLINYDKNSSHWRDYLRAYEFELFCDCVNSGKKYVIQITYMTPAGNRIIGEWVITYK